MKIVNNIDKFDEVKTNKGTYAWFRRDRRPARPEDALGIYRFSAAPLLPKCHTNHKGIRFQGFFAAAGITNPKKVRDVWRGRGSIVMRNMFGWLRSAGVLDMVHEEYDMYLHHQRESSGKANFGWLRNMYHSLVQQVIRRDPVYYMAYCMFRDDRPWRMISYHTT